MSAAYCRVIAGAAFNLLTETVEIECSTVCFKQSQIHISETTPNSTLASAGSFAR